MRESLLSGVCLLVAGGSSQNGGDIVEQLQSSVEGAGAGHSEIDVGISVIDSLATTAPRDHGEDDDPETIHQSGEQERAAQLEASQRAHGRLAALLHLAHGSYRILRDQSG